MKKYATIIISIFAMLSAAAVASRQTTSVNSAAAKQAALQGASAIKQLKQSGTYDSLASAVNAARYNAQPIQNTKAFKFVNPEQGFNATFAAADSAAAPGLRVATGETKQQNELAIKLVAYGYDGNLSLLKTTSLDAKDNRVEYGHALNSVAGNSPPAIREWFINNPEGIEHGFVLSAPPAGKQAESEQLRVQMEIGGSWQPVLEPETQTVGLRSVDGAQAFRYGKLHVFDARQKELPAHFELDGKQLSIVVDDRAAEYPLTIDQVLALQAKIIGPSGGPNDHVGASVAISGDTAVVGAPDDDITSPDQGSVYVFTRTGDTWTQQAKIVAEPDQDEYFGVSVAIDGDTLVAGAYKDNIGSSLDQGSAYVYARTGTTWNLRQKLTAVDGTDNNWFGLSVAISGTTVLASAPLTNSTYVFALIAGTWRQQQKLTPSDNVQDMFFGGSVALDGDTALVGAFGASNGTGAVYVFKRVGVGWGQQQKLTASDGLPDDQFGFAVTLSGDTAAIGAPGDDNGAIVNQGSAYVFVRNGAGIWVPQTKLSPSAGDTDDFFGIAIALNADFLAVGAAYDDVSTALNQGSVYVFSRESTTWTQRDKLIAIDGAADDSFGRAIAVGPRHLLVGSLGSDIGGDANEGAVYAFQVTGRIGINGGNGILGGETFGAGGDLIGTCVAISGDTVVVGAPGTDVSGFANQGVVYVYQRNGAAWVLQATVTAPDGDSNDFFGDSVAINGDTLVVGAPRDGNPGLPERGAAYVFVRIGTVWNFEQRLFPANGRANDHFGWSVGVSGDTIGVGAPDYDGTSGAVTNSGAIYVFTRSAGLWSQQTTAGTNVQESKLGWSVALRGNTLAAGAPLRSVSLLSQGMVRIYTRTGTTWTNQLDLTAPDAVSQDQFGISVALSEDENTLVSGSFFADAPNTNQGAAYVFKRANAAGSQWNLEAKLTDVNGQAQDNFGEDVSISGENIIVGARVDNEPGVNDWGSAFVFERRGTSWIRVQQLNAFTAQAGIFFGGSVGISGGQMVIGAPGFDDGAQTDQGVAFIAGGLGCLSLTVTPATLPNGFVGNAYSQTLNATGDSQPHNFVVSGGSLPVGLGLTSSGTLSGTPVATGTYNFTVTATGPNMCSASRNYTVAVTGNCGEFTINPTSQNFTAAGGSGLINVTADGGCSWSASSNAGWITLNNFGGVGDDVISFTVAINTGPARVGTLTVAGRGFIVNQSASTAGSGLQFYPLAHPVRLLDTRAGASGCDAPGAMIAGGTFRTQTAAGRTCDGLTIPSNARVLIGNITTVESGGGFLTLYPSDIPKPLAANSNYAANQILNNVFTVGLGGNDGAFNIFVNSNTNVVVDVTGYYAPPSASGLYFHPLPRPVRWVDTRVGATACFTPGAPLSGGSTATHFGTGTCDVTIPAGALAVVGNATAVNPQANGFLTLFPADATRPLVASSNFQTGINMNTAFTVGLSPSGQFNIFTASTTDLVIDLLGYYSTQLIDANGQGLLFNALPTPVRLLDTRQGQPACFTPGAPMNGGGTYTQDIIGTCTTIFGSARAVVGNATTVNATANGFLTFWPSTAPSQPFVATSNYRAGQVFNRHFTVVLGGDNAFNRFASTTTDLVIDLVGYFAL